MMSPAKDPKAKKAPKPSPTPIALSPGGIADRLGVSIATINRLCRAGKLKKSKIGSRSLIRVAEADALLDCTTQDEAA